MEYKFSEEKKIIVISHPSRKDYYLKKKVKNPYINMEVLTIDEMRSLFDYSYDDRAVRLLLKKGYGYDMSKEILKALSARHYDKGIEVKEYDSLRNELLESNLLFKLPYPEKTFENADILVSGYYGYDEIIKDYLGDAPLIHEEFDLNENSMKEYVSFSNPYEELHYVFNEIAHDIDEGTPIQDIYIYGIDSNYINLIKQFSKYYGFEIYVEHASRLYDSVVYRLFKEEFLKNGIDSAISKINKVFPESKDVDVITKFALRFADVFEDKEKTIVLYDEIAKKENKSHQLKSNVVGALEEAVAPIGSHVYLLNFSMGTYPKAPTEKGLFSDEEKERIGLDTSYAISKRDSLIIEAALRSKSLKLITFVKEGFDKEKFECSFKEKHDMKEIKGPCQKYEYALDKGAFLAASLQDEKRKYLMDDPRRETYEKMSGIGLFYPTYDPSYKGKKTERIAKKEFSYSSLKTYRECPFKFLMSKGLYLDKNEGTLYSHIGTLFHNVLEARYRNFDLDFEESFELEKEKVIKENNLSKKDRVILENLKNYCKTALDFQIYYEKYLQNPHFYPEDSFHVDLGNGLKIGGRYDKITVFEHNGKKYLFVIDYKSGSERFDKELFENFGLSLQLPLYALSIEENKKEFDNAEIAGLFISPILGFSLDNKGGEIAKKDQESLQLVGLYLNDTGLWNIINPLMDEAGFVSKMSINKEGFFKSKTDPISKEQIDELVTKAKEYIDKFEKEILEGKFDINPLKIKGGPNACNYCSFHDVCYVNKKKIKILNKKGEEIKEDDEEGEEDAAE